MRLLFPAFCWVLLGCIFSSASAAPSVEPIAHGEGKTPLVFSVKHPSGRMLWFAASVFFFVASAAVALWHYAGRKRLRQVIELERRQLVEIERARIARDMHDGLGANLVKIALLGEIIDGDQDDAPDLRTNVGKMVSAARESVLAMDQIVWAVDPRNDSIENLATYLCQFAREHFEVAMIRLEVDVPEELPPGLLSAEKRYQLFLAAKEVMTNIVKHAHATEVSINLRIEGSCFMIVIRDNGCGLPVVSPKARGRGRSNLRERLAALGGSVECSSKPDEGTEFTLCLPLSGN